MAIGSVAVSGISCPSLRALRILAVLAGTSTICASCIRRIGVAGAGSCICAICLCGASWAWFTASTSTGTTQIQSSSYKLLYQVGEDATPTELAEVKTVTVPESSIPESSSCKITLSATGTAGATGYCSIKIGDETYYTKQISVNDTSGFTFTVNAAADTTITLTPKWGTYSHAATLHNGDVIPATGSQPSNTQTPDNTVTTEPSTEPTAPTAPTTPSSTPAESATTAPEPSATAPTQPESTDTEPSSAPETATPENTTAAQTEPPTTEESESN